MFKGKGLFFGDLRRFTQQNMWHANSQAVLETVEE